MKFSFPPIDNCVTGEAGKRSVLRNGRITRLPETIIRRQCGFAAITGTTISLFRHATICNRCVLVSRLRRKIANVARSRVAKRIRVQVLRESRWQGIGLIRRVSPLQRLPLNVLCPSVCFFYSIEGRRVSRSRCSTRALVSRAHVSRLR